MTFWELIPEKSCFSTLNYIHRTPPPLLFKIFEHAIILNKHAAKIHKINKLRKYNTIITSKFHLNPTRFPHGLHLVVVEKTNGFLIAHCR